MVRPRKSGLVEEDDSESSSRSKSKFVFSDSDDDAEANEDLSLKIVQKAISRSSSHKDGKDGAAVRDSEGGGGGGGLGDDIVMTELVALDSAKKKLKKEKKKKKPKKIETEAQTGQVISAPLPEGQNTEMMEDLTVVKLSEEGDVNNNNNAVLQRLLRGPRYFDPPDSGWGTCYSCGEAGHSAVNCKSANKRKKPCFVCGSFEHGARNCQKGKDCFICNKSGHRAKDCSEKFKRCSYRSDLCLRCGSSGHDMSACSNNYPPDDLKEIQCYVCRSFGHLCCANYFGTTQAEVSCYKCGRLGHTGLSCRGSHGETAGEGTPASCFKCGEEGHFARECMTPYKASRTNEGTPSSCFKCGKEGHFARECASSVKDKKQSRELSTPKKKSSKENKAYKSHRSAPQDLDRGHKKKRLQFDDRGTSSKRRAYGGWIVDDSAGDFPRGNGGWESRPSTNYRDYQTSNSSSVRHPSALSPIRYGSPYPRSPSLQKPRNSYQNGFTASLSRFRSPNSGPRSSNSHKYF